MPCADATSVTGSPLTPQPYVVQRVRRETADTVTMDLLPRSTADEFRFAAGQFNMLYRFGVGEVPISISGDPSRPLPLVHTVRNVGATTDAICAVKRGDVLGVRGPYGKPWPVLEAEDQDVVVVAGGLGLAPLRSALYYFFAHRERYGRILLLYGARSPRDLLYRQELTRWGKVDLGVTVDRGGEGWTGHVGVVTTLLARERLDPARTVALMCGPEVMMRFTIRELERQGMTDDRIYVSLERNMECAVRLCGHCQLGPAFVCRDGPVFRYDQIRPFMAVREY
ncbi:MAG TPA: FAD/NAD(P)-binding protein [Thermomicrobiales bacterium]|jgi:NAD(P)H-flavin reductase